MAAVSKNSELVHRGERYHIQTESWLPAEPVLVTQIFKGGQLVLQTKVAAKGTNVTAFSAQEVEEAHHKATQEFKELLI